MFQKTIIKRAAAISVVSVLLSCLVTAAIALTILEVEDLLRAVSISFCVSTVVSIPVALHSVTQQSRIEALNRELTKAHDNMSNLNEELEIRASTDAMTGLLNRQSFLEHAERKRTSTSAGALLFVDLDRFKAVNDQFGHAAGDTALRLVADAIRRNIRSNDVAGRMGGEEFALYLPNIPIERACEVAERLRETVASIEFRPDDSQSHSLTVSIGLIATTGSFMLEDQLRAADYAMYEAKQSGRNRIALGHVAPPLAPEDKTLLSLERTAPASAA